MINFLLGADVVAIGGHFVSRQASARNRHFSEFNNERKTGVLLKQTKHTIFEILVNHISGKD